MGCLRGRELLYLQTEPLEPSLCVPYRLRGALPGGRGRQDERLAARRGLRQDTVDRLVPRVEFIAPNER
jgi:hypothetical protein